MPAFGRAWPGLIVYYNNTTTGEEMKGRRLS